MRVLALRTGGGWIVPLDFALDLATTVEEHSWFHRLPKSPREAMAFYLEPGAVAIDTRPTQYFLVEGRWEPERLRESGAIVDARVSGVTLDEAVRMVPRIGERVAATAPATIALEPEIATRNPSTMPLVSFPDEPRLRALLSRITYTRSDGDLVVSSFAVPALTLVADRAPSLVAEHRVAIREALDRGGRVAAQTHRSWIDRQGIHCLFLGDCRGFETELARAFETLARDADPPAGRDAATRQLWPRFAIRWLAARKTWGWRERKVFEHYVAAPLEDRFDWVRAPLPMTAPRLRPTVWPDSDAVTRDPDVAEWRALTSGPGWIHLRGLAIGGETRDISAAGEPPAPEPQDAPVHADMRLSLVNVGPAPIRATMGGARIRAFGRTRIAQIHPPLDLEVPPRTWVVWHADYSAPGTLPVSTKATMEVVLRSGSRTVTLRMPFAARQVY